MQIFRRVVLGIMVLGLTLSTLAILSCGGSDDDADETRLQANLSAANERQPPPPAPNPAGNGTAVLIISDDEQTINYTLTYAAVNDVTQAHIHVVNSSDLAGPIILFLCTNVGLGTNMPCAGAGPIPTPQPCPQGSVTITGTLTAADLSCKAATATSPAVLSFADAIAQLRAGNTYTNVHSTANPQGDIRGTDIFVD